MDPPSRSESEPRFQLELREEEGARLVAFER